MEHIGNIYSDCSDEITMQERGDVDLDPLLAAVVSLFSCCYPAVPGSPDGDLIAT
jgi:hypothetical protein